MEDGSLLPQWRLRQEGELPAARCVNALHKLKNEPSLPENGEIGRENWVRDRGGELRRPRVAGFPNPGGAKRPGPPPRRLRRPTGLATCNTGAPGSPLPNRRGHRPRPVRSLGAPSEFRADPRLGPPSGPAPACRAPAQPLGPRPSRTFSSSAIKNCVAGRAVLWGLPATGAVQGAVPLPVPAPRRGRRPCAVATARRRSLPLLSPQECWSRCCRSPWICRLGGPRGNPLGLGSAGLPAPAAAGHAALPYPRCWPGSWRAWLPSSLRPPRLEAPLPSSGQGLGLLLWHCLPWLPLLRLVPWPLPPWGRPWPSGPLSTSGEPQGAERP